MRIIFSLCCIENYDVETLFKIHKCSNIFFRKHTLRHALYKGGKNGYFHHVFLLLETKEKKVSRTKLKMASKLFQDPLEDTPWQWRKGKHLLFILTL